MSYLSTTENVGFGGIPQNISDSTCATQYKMVVEGVPGNGDVPMFSQDSSGDEHSYVTHLNDNFFHTKFKIDPNELYTFHDSDVIASEITVSHTEDNFMFSDNDIKCKLQSPNKEIDLITSITNGEIKEEQTKEVISNGHYQPTVKKDSTKLTKSKDSKTSNAKVPRVKNQSQVKEPSRSNTSIEGRRPSVHSPRRPNQEAPTSPFATKNSITSVSHNVSTNNVKQSSVPKLSAIETFLDVFKREQGLSEGSAQIKIEPGTSAPVKLPTSHPKKTSAGKTPSQPKSRRGRGPAVHEALQRIPSQKRAQPVANRPWHAPGHPLFQCGPLDERKRVPFTHLDTSSSDDDNMPDFGKGSAKNERKWCVGSASVEESVAESRSARLATRRAALRRRMRHARTSLQHRRSHGEQRTLANTILKQLQGQGPSCRLPVQTVNFLLSQRGMRGVLCTQERRQLRETGWSGGESGFSGGICTEDRCTAAALPCARHCLSHVTQAPEQRLYAACAAVFAGGARCMQPHLPLHDQTPLCAEHAWKRDNYDKLSRDARPKKAVVVRKRVWAAPARAPRPPRKHKRRRRPPPRQEINVCSNSSAYDSSEETAMGAVSETEYIVTGADSHELEVEVGSVPPDDILDPAVLSQIPDEAFTEFFNQAEGGTSFAESSELAAALEAVLDERALDNITDNIAFPHSNDLSAAAGSSEHAVERVVITQ